MVGEANPAAATANSTIPPLRNITISPEISHPSRDTSGGDCSGALLSASA
jgi:hypothetical protein